MAQQTVHPWPDLQAVAEVHVKYELLQLVGTVTVDELTLRNPDDAFAVGGALLESFLVHARNINEFLTKQYGSRHALSVVAADYFDSRSWSIVTPPLDEDEMNSIHRRVSHISVERLKQLSVDGTWREYVKPWLPKLLNGVGTFITDLGVVHPDRAAWFHAGYNGAVALTTPPKRQSI